MCWKRGGRMVAHPLHPSLFQRQQAHNHAVSPMEGCKSLVHEVPPASSSGCCWRGSLLPCCTPQYWNYKTERGGGRECFSEFITGQQKLYELHHKVYPWATWGASTLVILQLACVSILNINPLCSSPATPVLDSPCSLMHNGKAALQMANIHAQKACCLCGIGKTRISEFQVLPWGETNGRLSIPSLALQNWGDGMSI